MRGLFTTYPHYGRFTNVDVAQVHRAVVAASAELQAATVDDELALSTPIVQLTREGKS